MQHLEHLGNCKLIVSIQYISLFLSIVYKVELVHIQSKTKLNNVDEECGPSNAYWDRSL